MTYMTEHEKIARANDSGDIRDRPERDWAAEAEIWLARASGHHRDKVKSFERCDTDGFLSHWASDMSRDLCRLKAEICENEGFSFFKGLYKGDRRVKAKLITFKDRFTYGNKTMWLVDDSDPIAESGRRWFPVGRRSRILREFGLVERTEKAPAWACMDGTGTGLSGRAWVTSFRTGDKWGLDSVLCDDEEGR